MPFMSETKLSFAISVSINLCVLLQEALRAWLRFLLQEALRAWLRLLSIRLPLTCRFGNGLVLTRVAADSVSFSSMMTGMGLLCMLC